MTTTKRVYRGQLSLTRNAGSRFASDPQFLSALATNVDSECFEQGVPLSHQISEAGVLHGVFVSVRYIVGDTRKELNPSDPFGNGWVKLKGVLDALGKSTQNIRGEWSLAEYIRIGNRDFLLELYDNLDKFCHMEITYAKPK